MFSARVAYAKTSNGWMLAILADLAETLPMDGSLCLMQDPSQHFFFLSLSSVYFILLCHQLLRPYPTGARPPTKTVPHPPAKAVFKHKDSMSRY